MDLWEQLICPYFRSPEDTNTPGAISRFVLEHRITNYSFQSRVILFQMICILFLFISLSSALPRPFCEIQSVQKEGADEYDKLI